MKNIQNLLRIAAFGIIISTLCIFTTESQEIIHEGFDNGKTAPTGWTFKVGGTYTSASSSGDAIPSIKLSATGNFIETCDFSNANEFSFMMKGASADPASALVILYKSEETWIKLDSITNIPNTKKTLKYSLSENATKLRFTYYKIKGNIAFDDLIIKKSEQIIDTIPPKFINQSPKLIYKSSTSTICSICLDKPGKAYYILTSADCQAPTIPDFLDTSKYNNTCFLKAGIINLGNKTDTSISFSGLKTDVSYCIYWYTSSLTGESKNGTIIKSDFKNSTIVKDLNDLSESIHIWPNPADKILNIKLPLGLQGAEISIEMISTIGRVFHPKIIGNEIETKLLVGELHNGIYWLVIRNGIKNNSTMVIVKNK
jgi:hypothetical protein